MIARRHARRHLPSRMAILCAGLAGLLAGGCAHIPIGPAHGQEDSRLHVRLAPVEISSDVDHEAIPDDQLPVVVARVSTLLRQSLSGDPRVLLIDADDNATRVDAVLDVRISGYGKLKRKWLVYLIGSGIAEGVVQGVVIARVTGAPWAGVAVGTEEIGQEILTWGGGSWLFNRAYAPVTLEGKLVDPQERKTLWHDMAFVAADHKVLKKLPPEFRNRRTTQIDVSARKAVRELAKSLGDRLRCTPACPSP